MNTEKKIYQSPRLAECGNAVDATQLKITGPLEPGNMGRQFGAGDMGFGL